MSNSESDAKLKFVSND